MSLLDYRRSKAEPWDAAYTFWTHSSEANSLDFRYFNLIFQALFKTLKKFHHSFYLITYQSLYTLTTVEYNSKEDDNYFKKAIAILLRPFIPMSKND